MVQSMRLRRHHLSPLSACASVLYFGQILLLTLHFLTVEHGIVSRGGTLAHGSGGHAQESLPHRCSNHDDRDEGPGLLPENPPKHRPGCLFLSILLRSSLGIERPTPPSAGPSDRAGAAGPSPRPEIAATTSCPLTLAPKHSPPSSS